MKEGRVSPKDALCLVGVSAGVLVVFRRQIVPNALLSFRRWREEPIRQLGRVALSAMAGQGLFWSVGYDQLGLLMDAKVQMGLGRRVAKVVYERLPESPAVPWLIKAVEIAADAGKIPLEGSLYRRYGIVPDAVGAIIGQPLWSAVETAEKLAGVIAHPDRVGRPEQVKVSLGCVYGTVVRYVADGCIFLAGRLLTTAR